MNLNILMKKIDFKNQKNQNYKIIQMKKNIFIKEKINLNEDIDLLSIKK